MASHGFQNRRFTHCGDQCKTDWMIQLGGTYCGQVRSPFCLLQVISILNTLLRMSFRFFPKHLSSQNQFFIIVRFLLWQLFYAWSPYSLCTGDKLKSHTIKNKTESVRSGVDYVLYHKHKAMWGALYTMLVTIHDTPTTPFALSPSTFLMKQP